jgi:hypothetical protein
MERVRIPYKSGRVDHDEKYVEDLMNFYKGKYGDEWKLFVLPKPNHPEMLKKIYDDKYGFGIREIVTLNGAHCLGGTTFPDGKMRTWTETPEKFSNSYYTGLKSFPWSASNTLPAHDEDKGTENRLIWRDGKDLKLILLETDFVLRTNVLRRVDDDTSKEMRKTAQEFASDEVQFFKDFAAVFSKASELGWEGLAEINIPEE